MTQAVYGCNHAVALFVSRLLGGGLGFGNCTAIGFAKGSELVAGVVYHNWDEKAGVIEISAASTRRDWVSRDVLRTIFAYPFDQLGCRMCIARIAETNTRARRIWQALGAKEHMIDGLRGPDEAEAIYTLSAEQWRRGKFNG